VDLDKGAIRLGVGTTKNKDGRLVYLPAEALEAFRAWRDRTRPLSSTSGVASSPVSFTAGVSRSSPSRTSRGDQHVSGRGSLDARRMTSAARWHATTAAAARPRVSS
jgi:integrase